MAYLEHGRRHLPGGTDPIPNLQSLGGWGYGRFISVLNTGLGGLASGAYTDVDFTGLQARTNDSGFTTSSLVSSPFTGDHFSFDWSGDSLKIKINEQGLYRVFRTFAINVFPSPPGAAYTIGINATGGSPAAVNDPLEGTGQISNTILPAGTGIGGNPVITLEQEFVVENPSGFTVGLQVMQESGLVPSSAAAKIAVIRYGDQTPQ